MPWFEAGNHSEAFVPADRKEVWAALTDPDLLLAPRRMEPPVKSNDMMEVFLAASDPNLVASDTAWSNIRSALRRGDNRHRCADGHFECSSVSRVVGTSGVTTGVGRCVANAE